MISNYEKEYLKHDLEACNNISTSTICCIYQIMSFFFRLLSTRLQDQVEHEGMLQPVQCKVGILSAFLDMVRLLSQLLRSVETFKIYILILLYHLIIHRVVTLSYSNLFTTGVFVFSCTGQELQFHTKA